MSNFLTPGPDAKAEPYTAIMETSDEGNTTGNLWTFGGRIMLFKEAKHATSLLKAVKEQSGDNYATRGVTEDHLVHMRKISKDHKIPLFVVLDIKDDGTVEAFPIEQVEAEKN